MIVAIGMSAQDNKSQVKITQDSIAEIHGQPAGRLRPVVSDGFYQESSTNGQYNRVLDTETGLHAGDTIPFGETYWAEGEVLRAINNAFNDSIIGTGLFGGQLSPSISGATFGSWNYCIYAVKINGNKKTAVGVEFFLSTAGVYTEDTGADYIIQLYRLKNDGSLQSVAKTYEYPNMFKAPTGSKRLYFQQSATVNDSIYYVGIFSPDDGASTTPALYKQATINDLYSRFKGYRLAASTTDPNWTVMPDETSISVFTSNQTHYAIFNVIGY